MALILQALLAFAVTMLGLATIVTLIMEFSSRISRRRGRVFGQMLDIVFEKEIWPYIKQHYDDAPSPSEIILEDFKKNIQASPLEADDRFAKALSPLISFFAADRSDQLSKEEFLRRLGRSEVGSQLFEKQSQVDQLVERMCLRYDELADASSEYFKTSSGIVSLIIGVALAFAVNLDGYKIISFYIANPDVAEQVSEQADTLLEEQVKASKRLESALETLDDSTAGPVDAKQAAKQDLQEAQAVLAKAREQVGTLAVLDVPVGWSQFPYCAQPSAPSQASPGSVQRSARCKQADELDTTDSAYLAGMLLPWIFTTALTGFLIGLGGPFWFDAVQGLMRATQMLRGRAPTADTQSTEQRAQSTAVTPVQIFTQHLEPPATNTEPA